jgi:hypothetical protein
MASAGPTSLLRAGSPKGFHPPFRPYKLGRPCSCTKYTYRVGQKIIGLPTEVPSPKNPLPPLTSEGSSGPVRLPEFGFPKGFPLDPHRRWGPACKRTKYTCKSSRKPFAWRWGPYFPPVRPPLKARRDHRRSPGRKGRKATPPLAVARFVVSGKREAAPTPDRRTGSPGRRPDVGREDRAVRPKATGRQAEGDRPSVRWRPGRLPDGDGDRP